MPKVAYSDADRERVRTALITTALDLMSRQGVQHTTVEQVYKAVGISRTFFYTFFPSKEDLIVETLYFQQPKLLAYAQHLMEDLALDWREGVAQFLTTCCYGERSGIATLTVEEQQLIFRRLSPESYRIFRTKQARLFDDLLSCFGVQPSPERTSLFTNLCLAVIIFRHAIPDTLPLFVPEAADQTTQIQIHAIVDCLEAFRRQDQTASL